MQRVHGKGGQMTRRTSIEAYHRIRDEGLLSKARFVVYERLYLHGPKTAGELFAGIPNAIVKGSVCARLTELRDMGVVMEVGEAQCALTGQTAIVWDVTEFLPRKLDKAPKEATKPELIRAASNLLERALRGISSPKAGDRTLWEKWEMEAKALLNECAKYRVQK
jgi:hypothetical protein